MKNSLPMLDGPRFDFRANQQYRIDASEWAKVADNPQAMIKMVQWLIDDHYTYQVPRILTLERYYNGDNDIIYWKSKKAADRADNRIASGLPHYSTDINTGYELGNPLTYGYTNPDNEDDDGGKILPLIENVNAQNDMGFHDKELGKAIHNTGRGYELTYVKEGTHDIAVRDIDPANCFVVYDTTLARHSLFAVYYYLSEFLGKDTFYATVFTSQANYYYRIEGNTPQGDMLFLRKEEQYMFDVPVTEFDLNRERMGQWERKLSTIDAIDKANSEMANSEEDFSNSILVISGDIDDPDASANDDGLDYDEPLKDSPFTAPMPLPKGAINPLSRILYLKPSVVELGNGDSQAVPTSAQYLTKSLDPDGWKLYIDHLINDFHKESNSPDMSDEQFSGNATGVAFSYKLLGTDQERSNFETLFRRGIMRSLRLMSNYWYLISSLDNQEFSEVNNVTVTFTPNLPKADSEMIQNLTALSNMQAFSKQTIRDKASDWTGVSADQEAQRVKQEEQDELSREDGLYQNHFGTDQEKNGGGVDGHEPDENSAADN